jgi:hypothetical protein
MDRCGSRALRCGNRVATKDAKAPRRGGDVRNSRSYAEPEENRGVWVWDISERWRISFLLVRDQEWPFRRQIDGVDSSHHPTSVQPFCTLGHHSCQRMHDAIVIIRERVLKICAPRHTHKALWAS